ncbi:MAG: formate dehydrogenase accessory sulfurtransferase FdhD [Proteobacteria bacterium]|nr:formate dehydrogenase accessory sulfurtransferase FdhD [Pseudomonadota bacterium]
MQTDSEPQTHIRGSIAVQVAEHCSGEVLPRIDQVVEEAPCVLTYNDIAHATMMATPTDLADFAVGFSLAEGIVDASNDIYSIDVRPAGIGYEVQMRLSARCFARLKSRRRSLLGSSGCGLCGVESLETMLPALTPLAYQFSLPQSLLNQAVAHLSQARPAPREAGALHTALFISATGERLMARHDVGRHNALDKLIGALAAAHIQAQSGLAIVSSRASFEMVAKCASAGISTLVSVSAPTSMAVKWAVDLNMNLIGFAGSTRHVVYCSQHQ